MRVVSSALARACRNAALRAPARRRPRRIRRASRRGHHGALVAPGFAGGTADALRHGRLGKRIKH
eukprot:265427-Chlamydomonas_euryale.AAC.7